jgi:hypothetical protein
MIIYYTAGGSYFISTEDLAGFLIYVTWVSTFLRFPQLSPRSLFWKKEA